MSIFNFSEFEQFCAAVAAQYEKTAPTVAAYADDLYVRVSESRPALVIELIGLSQLRDEGGWLEPNDAANRIYHLMHRAGRDTTGQAGF